MLAFLAISGPGMAKAAVTEFAPKFIDPAELFDVGGDDPYMYRWVTDPNMIDSSSWSFGGVGLASFANAALWVNQTLMTAHTQATVTNSGVPLFAVTVGASAPAPSQLPTSCNVTVHVYAVMDATATYSSAMASAHAEVGSNYIDSTNTSTVDMGTAQLTIPIDEPVAAKQPTKVGVATITGENLLARCFGLALNSVGTYSAYARAEVQYYIVGWTYIY